MYCHIPWLMYCHIPWLMYCHVLPEIVYTSLRHGAVHKWHDNGPQDLVTISLCIQIAIDKLQLCLLSKVYAGSYHNPTTTMGHCSQQTARPHNAIHATCSVQLKPGFFHEEHTSPACSWPSKVSIYTEKLVTTPNCSQVNTLVRITSTRMSFPEMVSDDLCRNSWAYFSWTDFGRSKTSCFTSSSLLTAGHCRGFSADVYGRQLAPCELLPTLCFNVQKR
jgi:hypothetical protein